MRSIIRIHTIPLWPFIKNVFLVSFVILVLLSLIFGFFWVGIVRELATQFGDSAFPMDPEALRSFGVASVIVMSVLNGIFGSVVLSLVVGIAGMIYNLVNGGGGGIELEVSFPQNDHIQFEESGSADRLEEPEEGENNS